ncbi:MAG: thioredoxin domain-containing protein [Acidimicrobiales bacterium]
MNHLSAESSPYLLQHADNPVEWYPWGPDALRRAKEEDKPIFVSIGYSSCHWCHVMAHESFEDREVAAALSESFISIKVDREERPDIDAIYMSALLSLTGSGGWPMSVFCTPDGRPFFAGTYFPPVDRYQMPSFQRVIGALADAWRSRREEVERQADELTAQIADEGQVLGASVPMGPTGPTSVLPEFETSLERLITYLKNGFDPIEGGFGAAPKFPRPTLIELCFYHHKLTGDPLSLEMATRTLDAMATGGIYDHLAGGFCRYSTDRTWTVPHFEKMLTDQALLARCYLHGWQYTKNDDYLIVLRETLDYVLTRLSCGEVALYSSEDADSSGVEGAHATFTEREVRDALRQANREDLVDELSRFYGITPEGNWESTNILRRPSGSCLTRSPDIEEGRKILLAIRSKRPHPAIDTKVITEWNAMAVAVLAEAAGALGDVGWQRRAEAIAEHLFENLRDQEGRWYRSWAGVRGRNLAYACDYAWLVDACTRLAELTGKILWIERAVELADKLISNFSDVGSRNGGGGLFTTANYAEALVVRVKDFSDGSTPCANSVAARALLRLAAISAEERFRSAAEEIIEAAAPFLKRHPAQLADMLVALNLKEHPIQVVLRTDRPEMLAEIRSRWLMEAALVTGEIADQPAFRDALDNAALVCENFTCMKPALDPATLALQLDSIGTKVGSISERVAKWASPVEESLPGQ